MSDETTKPTAGDVARRALALQLITDRGWGDNYMQTSPFMKRVRIKRVRKDVLNWAQREGIPEWLSPVEKKTWDQPFGKLSMEDRAFATWQLESLVPLTWALGVRDGMPEFSAPAKDNHYSALYFLKENPVGRILADTGLEPGGRELARSAEEIQTLTDAYMLCHWRAIERLLGDKKPVNMAETAPRIFGDSIKPAVALLPLTKKGDLVIEQQSLRISDVSKGDLSVFDKLFTARQKALNWLTGYEADWDNVTTDT